MLFVIAAGCLSFAADKPEYPFLDTTLDFEERAADLVSRLTLEEKTGLLNSNAEAIPRFGIKKYRYWNEALHGVARMGKYTVFPQAIALASTWDPVLIEKITTAISDEAWAGINREIPEKGYPGDYLLTFWSPTINMARDPRWGRTPETYGEDPFLTAEIAMAFVSGLQGYDKRYIKTVSTPKHFVANNEDFIRYRCNPIISERTLREYYFPAYRKTIQETNAQSIMGAYNALNGIPCNANEWLLTQVLRKEWGFDGFVVTDCGAPRHMYDQHKYAKDGAEATAFAINAGVDLECGGQGIFPNNLKEAIDRGLITEKRVDEAILNMMRVRMRLGMFDPPEMNPYTKIKEDVIGSPEHKELTRQTCRESIVLLKNEPVNGEKLLPIDTGKIKSIALLGPYGDFLTYGDYSGTPANDPVTLLGGIKNKVGSKIKINYVPWDDLPSEDAFSLAPEKLFSTETGEPGLKVEFFANQNFEGRPLISETVDKINYHKKVVPKVKEIRTSPYSVRWSGKLTAQETGVQAFSVIAVGAAELFINGRSLIAFSDTEKKDKGPRLKSGQSILNQDIEKLVPEHVASILMEKGKQYEISLEYVPVNAPPVLKLEWVPITGDGIETGKKQLDAVLNSDIVIAAMGYYMEHEHEGMDRKTLKLPADQHGFVKTLFDYNKNMIVALTTGSAVSINWMDKNVPAILETWYPGEQGGNGIADVLFGDYNPAGRLPFTSYKSVDDLLSFGNYEISEGSTYMYFDKEVLYPFGYGLSYTSFEYSGIAVKKAGDNYEVSFKLTNTGGADGEEVAQLYYRDIESKVLKPLKKLCGFKRVALRKGETKEVTIELDPDELAYWDESTKGFVVEPGEYELMVGASSSDIRLRKTLEI